ncbi:sensor histidine kinase [Marinobacterium weihaiense]|uniref:Sensor histidine kinase n=1 Tax=Marinobacterium weihaiense TaxID=2851016 RepID=A0ABS6MAA5_9GAMM|nr:sensor histidine kinase [Marinobacterium weihaiense]MBV0933223.1 sensor histidine kinase [Marinobacterium weihaiense]
MTEPRRCRRHTLKLWLILMLPLLLTITASAWVTYTELYRLRLDPVITHHDRLLDQLGYQLGQELGHIGQLTLLLKRSHAVDSSLQPHTPPQRAQLARHLARFSQSSTLISQLCWLDAHGHEQVRVNVIDGRPRPVPQARLQDKSQRYYVQAARALAADHIYYSPLDLNIEQGQVVRPLEPTLRTLVKTGLADDLHPGLLVLNFNLQPFFRQLRQQQDAVTRPAMINADGYWLLHADPAQEWGFALQQPEQTLQARYPQLWQQMQNASSARAIERHDRLWSYARIEPGYSVGSDADTPATHWFLLMSTPPDMLPALRQSLLLPIGLISLLALLLGGALLYRVAHSETQRRHLLVQLEQEQTSLKHTNTELQQALQHQQLLQDELVETRKLSSLGMTVAGVAHELNTPTGGALMTLSTLETDLQRLQSAVDGTGLTRTELTDYMTRTASGLALIRRHLGKAGDLIRRFKRLAQDRSLDAPVRFELQECLQDLQLSLQPRLAAQSVQLSLEVPACTLFSHPGILSQVLQNLVENALNHAFTHGTPGHIQVQGEYAPPADTSQTGAHPADAPEQLILHVRDDGNGIEPALQPTLFDPFVTSGRGRGHTGLGLHLVHQWVTQVLQGHIQLYSLPGQGTRFTLTLPIDLRDRQTSP